MATAAQYRAPSRDELANEIRSYAPAMCLYRGSPEWLRMEIGGRDFHIPPHLPGEPMIPHPTITEKDGEPRLVRADGKVGIRDVYGILRDIKNRNQPIGVGLLVGMDAGSLVMFAAENYKDAGVVFLRGDKSDDGRMEASRKQYQQHKLAWAKQEKDARAAVVKSVKDKDPSAIPPPPTRNQIMAQEILDAAALSQRTGAEFICQVCWGWEGDSFEKYATHMLAAHGRRIQSPEQETTDAPGKATPINVAELEAPVEATDGALPGVIESESLAPDAVQLEALKRKIASRKAG